jgi:hypothetical protein
LSDCEEYANVTEQTSSPLHPELVALLSVIASQVKAALRDTDAPAATLVTVAHSVSRASETVARCVFDFSGSPTRVFQDLVVLHDDLHAQASKAATAVQFHDRLVQCLTHTCGSLGYLAEFMSRGDDQQSAEEWQKLHERIRGAFSMENERIAFDLHKRGVSSRDVQAAVTEHQDNAGKVELF